MTTSKHKKHTEASGHTTTSSSHSNHHSHNNNHKIHHEQSKRSHGEFDATVGNRNRNNNNVGGRKLHISLQPPQCKKKLEQSRFTRSSLATTTVDNKQICNLYKVIKKRFNDVLERGSYVGYNRVHRGNTIEFRSAVIDEIVRLVFADAAEFDMLATDDKFGPDGCLSNTERNYYFSETGSFTSTFIEDVWQDHCLLISRADLWVMMGNMALEAGDTTGTMARLLTYAYGRRDNQECTMTKSDGYYNIKHRKGKANHMSSDDLDSQGHYKPRKRRNAIDAPVDRLSPLDTNVKGGEELEDIFHRLGLSLEENFVLMGAHTVGKLNPKYAGTHKC